MFFSSPLSFSFSLSLYLYLSFSLSLSRFLSLHLSETAISGKVFILSCVFHCYTIVSTADAMLSPLEHLPSRRFSGWFSAREPIWERLSDCEELNLCEVSDTSNARLSVTFSDSGEANRGIPCW